MTSMYEVHVNVDLNFYYDYSPWDSLTPIIGIVVYNNFTVGSVSVREPSGEFFSLSTFGHGTSFCCLFQGLCHINYMIIRMS